MVKSTEYCRYVVGSKYYFILIDYIPCDDKYRGTSMYLPWEDVLNKIEIKELRCVEHHLVPCDHEQTQEKNHDGFVFLEEQSDQQSVNWFNQYPVASYNQINTEADYFVRPSPENIEPWIPGISSRPYEDARILLDRTLIGIRDLKKAHRVREVAFLSEFYGKVVEILKNNFKVEVGVEPMKFRNIDGTIEEDPELITVVLKPIVSKDTP